MTSRSPRHDARRWRTATAEFTCFLACLVLGGCGGSDDDGARWHPEADDTWQWQLQGTIDTSYDVDVYDVDLFDTSRAVLDRLHDEAHPLILPKG